jgi:hypothetical protein
VDSSMSSPSMSPSKKGSSANLRRHSAAPDVATRLDVVRFMLRSGEGMQKFLDTRIRGEEKLPSGRKSEAIRRCSPVLAGLDSVHRVLDAGEAFLASERGTGNDEVFVLADRVAGVHPLGCEAVQVANLVHTELTAIIRPWRGPNRPAQCSDGMCQHLKGYRSGASRSSSLMSSTGMLLAH